MPKNNERWKVYERKVLMGVAVEDLDPKHPNNPRRWKCFVQGANGEGIGLPTVSKVHFTAGKRREGVLQPGPFVFEGSGTADETVLVKIMPVDKNLNSLDLRIHVPLQAKDSNRCGLLEKLTGEKPADDEKISEMPVNVRTCTVDGKPYTLTFRIDSLVFEFPMRRMRNALAVEPETESHPCVLDGEFDFFPGEAAGSKEFFDKMEEAQLQYLDMLIAGVEKAAEKAKGKKSVV